MRQWTAGPGRGRIPERGRDDAERWEAFVRERAGPLLGVARRLLPAAAEGELVALLGRALAQAWEHPQPAREAQRRVVCEAIRSSRPPAGLGLDLAGLLPRFGPAGAWLEAPRAWLAVDASDPELRRCLRGWIERLPEPSRGAVLACDVAGLAREDAAQALHVRRAALDEALHRGRQALRALLAEWMEGVR